MTKLIYHDKKSLKKKVSPFDRAIFELVEKKSIKIVCPYIRLSYIKRIINFSNGNWLLITDLNELIKSQIGQKNRTKIKDFILDNKNRVRHCSSLHAKAIITKEKIFFGSANFTSNGITRNNELSVLIDDLDKVIELNDWFDEWWDKSISTNDAQLTELILKTVDKPTITNPFHIKNVKSKISSGLYSLPNKDSTLGQITEEELASYLSTWENRNWTNNYFDLMKEIIEFTELENSDNRFAITVRRKKTGKWRIPLIIGQRYILAPFYNNDKDFGIGLIMSLEYNLENMNKDKVVRKFQDRVFNGEGGFTRNKKLEAHWLVFDTKDEFSFSQEVKNHWKNAVEIELKRTKYSRSRPKHQSIIYEAVMDLEFRKEILDLAF